MSWPTSSGPSPAVGGNADAIYDQIADALTSPAFRPRALYQRFGIDVIATTDDPCDDLARIASVGDDPTWTGRVIPTFRPDRYLEVGVAGWSRRATALAEASGIDTGDYAGFIAALEDRRRYFRSTEPSRPTTVTPMSAPNARSGQAPTVFAWPGRVPARRRGHRATPAPDVGDGPDVRRGRPGDDAAPGGLPQPPRDHLRAYGADVGVDIPVAVELHRGLQPLLSDFGTAPRFHLVLFTLDETTFSREIAPWPVSTRPSTPAPPGGSSTHRTPSAATAPRHRDRRIRPHVRLHRRHPRVLLHPGPPRHGPPARLRAYLAELVAEHRLDEDEALCTAPTSSPINPKVAFKL